MTFNLQIFIICPLFFLLLILVFFLLLMSNFTLLWSEKYICIISIFLGSLTFILWSNICSILENVFPGNVLYLLLEGMFYKCIYFGTKVQFESSVSLLSFCLGFIYCLKWGIKVSYHYWNIVYFFFCINLSICLIYAHDLMLGICIFLIVIFSSWIDPFYHYINILFLAIVFELKYVLSHIFLSLPFFGFLLAWNIFFHQVTWSHGY